MKHVLIALSRYERPLHSGITAYAVEHDWILNTEMVHLAGQQYLDWQGDGIIARPGEVPLIRELAFSGKFPVVLVRSDYTVEDLPKVVSDEEKSLNMAVEHFRSKGFRNFGCYGNTDSYRIRQFGERVEAHGLTCRFLEGVSSDMKKELARIRTWLKETPHPVAVYCNTDDHGIRLINLALEAGFNVPGDIAVLGTDNSPLTCNSSKVRLSSINTNLFQVGYTAARLLDRMMDGYQPDSMTTLIAPMGIVERESTNTIGATSPHVRRAIAIMEADYAKGISIADVVADVGISHSGLKKAFKRELNYTPVVALRNIRMNVAAQLLTTTDDKMRTIANAIGMKSCDHFQTVFKNHFKITPRKYRLAHRAG